MLMFSGEDLKAILRNYPTGVTVVTTVNKGEYYGLTVNSFASVSLKPPLVLVAIDKSLASHRAISESMVYAVNILPYDMKDVAIRFATAPREERFKGLRLFTSKTGSPIIDGSIAYLDCRVVATYDAGDHTLFIGQVEDGRVLNAKPPLIYLNRNYYTLQV